VLSSITLSKEMFSKLSRSSQEEILDLIKDAPYPVVQISEPPLTGGPTMDYLIATYRKDGAIIEAKPAGQNKRKAIQQCREQVIQRPNGDRLAVVTKWQFQYACTNVNGVARGSSNPR
jgi:hypothetical protein